jgi:hypothetical protein
VITAASITRFGAKQLSRLLLAILQLRRVRERSPVALEKRLVWSETLVPDLSNTNQVFYLLIHGNRADMEKFHRDFSP